MNIMKRLDDLLWYNNKYIHKIEDTFFIFLTNQEIYNYYLYFKNNPCSVCKKCEIKLPNNIPNNIEEPHPTLWRFNGCKCSYYRIALSNTYRENYNKNQNNQT